jgi:DNA polymerase-3 subunit epsilon
MFAIIDIETTGGNAKTDKITDICIVIHDGLSVVEKYSTLINPEKNIPPFISRLTGISNEMVKDAPKFYEVARKIVELTEGMIFVAHNVNFDFGFVQAEFRSLGYSYKRDQLCTVKLSRKLIPGKKSYSLGNLCESLGISNSARHRAEGDAVATAELFSLLLQKKNEHPVFKKQNLDMLNTSRLDQVKEHLIRKLPEETGIYYFLDKTGKIIYIGKSNNIRQRAFQHLLQSPKITRQLYDIDYEITGSELLALIRENEEIKNHQPEHNKARKASEFPFCISYNEDYNGLPHYEIKTSVTAQTAIRYFVTKSAAREKLDQWIDEYKLCLRYTGIDDNDGPCFNYQIKKCYGVCCNEEKIDEYIERTIQLKKKEEFHQQRFLLFDRGRNPEEQVLFLVENGQYKGYGYLNIQDSYSSEKELISLIQITKSYPDAAMFIHSFLRTHPTSKIISLES